MRISESSQVGRVLRTNHLGQRCLGGLMREASEFPYFAPAVRNSADWGTLTTTASVRSTTRCIRTAAIDHEESTGNDGVDAVVAEQMVHDPAEEERRKDFWGHDKEVEDAHVDAGFAGAEEIRRARHKAWRGCWPRRCRRRPWTEGEYICRG